mgnify:FL=1
MPTETRIFDIALALPRAVNCDLCVGRLRRSLAERPGVQAVALSRQGDRLIVEYDPRVLSSDDLAAAVDVAGAAISRRFRHETLTLTEMDCPECARGIQAALSEIPGVISARVDFTLGRLELAYDAEAVSRQAIIDRIRALGYGVAETQPTALRFRLQGLDCAECAEGLAGLVRGVPGVIEARVDFVAATLTATVEGDGDVIGRISAAVAQAGYTARLETGELGRVPARRDLWTFLLSQRRGRRTLAAAVGVALGALTSVLPVPPLTSIAFYVLAIVAGGYDVARSALTGLRTTRTLDMNVLMSVAVIGAAAIGQFAEAGVVILLFSLGNTLEAYTLDRARDAVRTLVELAPQEATLIHADHEERVRVEALQVGDRVRVRPGERIPADGEVLEGSSAVDESPITGEATPVDKGPGDPVYAGTVSGYGALVVRVTEVAGDSTLARIVRLVEEAQAQKAPSQRFVDRFSRVYTPAVIAGAVGIAAIPPLITGTAVLPWVYRALVLLVIACPCALVISTPVAIVSALARSAGDGVLIKGGTYLEAAAQLHAMAFDKTGTLTTGRPAVTDVIPFDGQSEEGVLTLAAALERNSEHPLAQAVVREARHRGIVPTPARDFAALPGRGARGRVDGQVLTIGNRALLGECVPLASPFEERLLELEQEGKTVFLLGRCPNGGDLPRELLGAIAVADRLRPESAQAIRGLREAGLRHIVLLTGDNPSTAGAIGRQAGVDQVRANLLPQEKVAAVEELLADYRAVGMVGDGVNDAPALARATVGIAMGAAGTDAALETADIALMGDDLSKVPETLRLSRRALGVIRQNVALSLAIKGAFVLLASLGLATLWMAVFADMGTSLLVTLNGMRLARS